MLMHEKTCVIPITDHSDGPDQSGHGIYCMTKFFKGTNQLNVNI